MKRATLRELVLAMALFINPFGYNELFALTMKLTGSYWRASLCFYVIASVLFALYLKLKRGTRNV